MGVGDVFVIETPGGRATLFEIAALQCRGLLGLAACASTGTGSGAPSRGLASAVAVAVYRLASRLNWDATDVEVERVQRLGAEGYVVVGSSKFWRSDCFTGIRRG